MPFGGKVLEERLLNIEGCVDKVIYRNENTSYVVIDLDMGNAMATVVGELGNVEEGEVLKVSGNYINHPKFGVQFSAKYCERKLPQSAYAIQKYLSSGVIKGIGPSLAERIVDAFGERTLDVIENTPSELLKIKGISPKKYNEISQEFNRIFGIRRLMIFLSEYGVPPSFAVKAWKRWGQFSIDIIKENPYCLCGFGIELDFQKADKIAKLLDMPFNSMERIRAGIAYVLSGNTLLGHTCLPTDRLQKSVCDFLGVSEEDFYKTLEYEYKEENVIEYIKGNISYSFLPDYYVAERYISSRIEAISDFFKDNLNDYEQVISLEEEREGIKYEELQRKAISLALSRGFLILTGGPGTGKTTTLNAIISLYEQQGMRVMICAPTGRAAKRISDLTGYEAKTIHRLLEMGYDGDGKLKFIHNENNPINCDVLIVDEMSMVDTLLFEALLRGIKLNCRLIMVGDSNQLPSVGAGNLLKDMIESGKITVVELKKIFRQAQQSCIVTNAHRIVNGEVPDLTKKDSDFFFLQRQNEETVLETVVDLYKNRLPKAYGYSPLDDIQILSPTRKGVLGVIELNKRLQAEINPPQKHLSEAKSIIYTFRENDKVMQTKNNYDIVWIKDNEAGAGIFNGDIGTIKRISKRDGVAVIDFDGRIAEYSLDMLEQLELAYAVTVHKSQGSEFPAVIIPLFGGFSKLYYRSLLYTAVTRAKKLLIIVGSKERIEYMVANNRKALRHTCLKHMLEGIDFNEQI